MDGQTVTDLGQKFKAKYPRSYDDLDDADVGRRVKAKYPGAYDDFADVAPQQAAQPQSQAQPLSRVDNAQQVIAGNKPLLPQVGPQMQAQHPFLSGIANTGANAINAATDFGLGAAKGLLHTGQNAADAATMGLKPLAEHYIPALGQQRQQTNQALRPGNAAQKVGYGSEQAAEMFAPSGAEGEAAKVVDASTKLPFARVLGKSIINAATSGGMTALQTEDPKSSAMAAGGAGATTAGIAAAAPVIRGAGRATAEILGKTTGAGSKPIMQAAKAPTQDLIQQMRQPDEMRVLSSLQDALQGVKDSRAAQYAQKLPALNNPNAPSIDSAPILAALDKKLGEFRVNKVPNPPQRMNAQQVQQWMSLYGNAQPGSLDFGASPLSDSGQAVVKKANDLISGWRDWSPAGGDALKRRLDALNSESSEARALLTPIRNEVKGAITRVVPEYDSMTGGYAQASQFVDQLRDLSLNSKNPGTAIRKITTTLNQNNNYRQMLVEALQPYAGADLTGQTAGLALSKLAPRGIMGPATGAGLMLSILTGHTNPAAAVTLAMTSPRLMGELAVAMGKTAPMVGKVAKTVGPTAGAIAARPNGVMPPPQ